MPASMFCDIDGSSSGFEEQRALQLAFELSMLGLSDGGGPGAPTSAAALTSSVSVVNEPDAPSIGALPSSFIIADETRSGGKKSQNMTECVPVPSSEHVAEIVGRQGCTSRFQPIILNSRTYIILKLIGSHVLPRACPASLMEKRRIVVHCGGGCNIDFLSLYLHLHCLPCLRRVRSLLLIPSFVLTGEPATIFVESPSIEGDRWRISGGLGGKHGLATRRYKQNRPDGNGRAMCALGRVRTSEEEIMADLKDHSNINICTFARKSSKPFTYLYGCKIKSLRAKTNTYIKTPVRGEEPVFVVTGRKEDVAKAKKEILSAADHFSQIRASRKNNLGGCGGGLSPPGPPTNVPGNVTIQVRVPYRVVGLVVGPKGATIKRIQHQTHTYIVTPSRDKEPVFEVTGLPEHVEAAKRDIEAHIALRTGTAAIPGLMAAAAAAASGSPNSGGLMEDASAEIVASLCKTGLGGLFGGGNSTNWLEALPPQTDTSPTASVVALGSGFSSASYASFSAGSSGCSSASSSSSSSCNSGTTGLGDLGSIWSMSLDRDEGLGDSPSFETATASSSIWSFPAVTRPSPPNSASPAESLSSVGGKRDCVICGEREITAALVPCGHNLFCMECGEGLCEGSNPTCPISLCFVYILECFKYCKFFRRRKNDNEKNIETQSLPSAYSGTDTRAFQNLIRKKKTVKEFNLIYLYNENLAQKYKNLYLYFMRLFENPGILLVCCNITEVAPIRLCLSRNEGSSGIFFLEGVKKYPSRVAALVKPIKVQKPPKPTSIKFLIKNALLPSDDELKENEFQKSLPLELPKNGLKLFRCRLLKSAKSEPLI
ncbi:unnamed protein product [Nesidiocoris tenuis]|uniref:RING-type domain-containing protein n=1 Tax=Nesidiocoris tenuis TaxID=355587 RepID=A0A6H5G7Y8_9HEMI|nr:unnamed protein product [Nesidiocoris tenuis]